MLTSEAQPNLEKIHHVWRNLQITNRTTSKAPIINFDEIVSTIFSTGQSYYYVIDFTDMSISGISTGFTEAHGIAPESINHINDILSLIHPDDMEFVSKAEENALSAFYSTIEAQKLLKYKASYNFRFKVADGTYRLYNHQSLILTLDENDNLIKSLNIHTDISHITTQNNYKYSLIGLLGEPSFLNLDVLEQDKRQCIEKTFTKREMEILRLITKGLTSKAIAQMLFISVDTVKTHRKNILIKANCMNCAQLTARSISEGWI